MQLPWLLVFGLGLALAVIVHYTITNLMQKEQKRSFETRIMFTAQHSTGQENKRHQEKIIVKKKVML